MPLASVQSNSVLWPASALIDGNYLTTYSSNIFPSATNIDTYVAAWSSGSNVVQAIRLYARNFNGRVLGFPRNYNVYLTSANNSAWVPIGTFAQQPDATGVVTINLPTATTTWGILISPVSFGTDDYGNYVFQLSEIELVKSAIVAIPPSAPTIGGVAAGNGSASVAFTPGALGTGTLINYTANCGGISASGTSSPITVSGLTNGKTYTCQVKTTSSVGVSAWSAWSGNVTPTDGCNTASLGLIDSSSTSATLQADTSVGTTPVVLATAKVSLCQARSVFLCPSGRLA